MKTQDEIVTRLEEVQREDRVFDFRSEVLVGALDYKHAEPFLKKGVTAKEWKADVDPSEAAQLKEALDYLEFAWGKAADHRGLSAGRSIQKLATWAWLLDRDELAEQMENGPYAQYGAPALKAFAEAFDSPLPDTPDLVRMMEGLPCREDCEEGCGA